jgi:hypothetical protein
VCVRSFIIISGREMPLDQRNMHTHIPWVHTLRHYHPAASGVCIYICTRRCRETERGRLYHQTPSQHPVATFAVAAALLPRVCQTRFSPAALVALFVFIFIMRAGWLVCARIAEWWWWWWYGALRSLASANMCGGRRDFSRTLRRLWEGRHLIKYFHSRR